MLTSQDLNLMLIPQVTCITIGLSCTSICHWTTYNALTSADHAVYINQWYIIFIFPIRFKLLLLVNALPDADDAAVVVRVCALVGKYGAHAALYVLLVFSAEVYPTVVRWAKTNLNSLAIKGSSLLYLMIYLIPFWLNYINFYNARHFFLQIEMCWIVCRCLSWKQVSPSITECSVCVCICAGTLVWGPRQWPGG